MYFGAHADARVLSAGLLCGFFLISSSLACVLASQVPIGASMGSVTTASLLRLCALMGTSWRAL